MRRLSPALFTTSLALVACFALAQAATVYNAAVSGSQTASPEVGAAALQLNAAGDLHGMFSLSVKHEGGQVVGGSWALTVLPPNADATSSEKGRLTGTLGGGALELDANGLVTAAASLQLAVEGGTGDYASVTAGGGTLSLSADPENPSKLGGPLALNF